MRRRNSARRTPRESGRSSRSPGSTPRSLPLVDRRRSSAGIFTVLIIALVLRSNAAGIPPGSSASARSCSLLRLALGGYTFLRDDELEPYRGLSLLHPGHVCGAVYAALWGAYAWLPGLAFNLQRLELFHLLLIVPPLAAVGPLPPSIRWISNSRTAMIHFALYVLVTAALGLIIGVPFLGPPPV